MFSLPIYFVFSSAFRQQHQDIHNRYTRMTFSLSPSLALSFALIHSYLLSSREMTLMFLKGPLSDHSDDQTYILLTATVDFSIFLEKSKV